MFKLLQCKVNLVCLRGCQKTKRVFVQLNVDSFFSGAEGQLFYCNSLCPLHLQCPVGRCTTISRSLTVKSIGIVRFLKYWQIWSSSNIFILIPILLKQARILTVTDQNQSAYFSEKLKIIGKLYPPKIICHLHHNWSFHSISTYSSFHSVIIASLRAVHRTVSFGVWIPLKRFFFQYLHGDFEDIAAFIPLFNFYWIHASVDDNFDSWISTCL